jgi:hypothetical protein
LWSCSFFLSFQFPLSLVLPVLITASVFIFLDACISVQTYDRDDICGFSRTLSKKCF